MYKKIYLEICIVCIVHCGVLFRTYPVSLGFAAVAEGERVGIFLFIFSPLDLGVKDML